MRAIQIVNESGPDEALSLIEAPEPEASHMLTPGEGVVVEVHVAGVSFPELLQTRGQYQMKPPLPFIPGSEVGGVVLCAPEGATVKVGDEVAAFCMLGGWAETAVAPTFFTFPLGEHLDFAQGAALGPILAGEEFLELLRGSNVDTAMLPTLDLGDEDLQVASARGRGESPAEGGSFY